MTIAESRVPLEMQNIVVQALKHIESTQDLKVLFAVESGSRAWGFHSPDSDYDVRFIYIRPINWYLSIDDRRDVYDSFKSLAKGTPYAEHDLDIVGWDIVKVLHLMRKSNPQLFEWLNSPAIYYMESRQLVEHWNFLAHKILHLGPVHEHYKGMAKGNFREYLRGEMVRYKKYLYVLRPLLAAQYLRDHQALPPVDFNDLCLHTLPSHPADFQIALLRLLEVKMNTPELKEAPREPVLNDWIEKQLAIKWEEPPRDPLLLPELNQEETRDLLDRSFRRMLATFDQTIA
jgi:predicted nucleotidyltransferase